MYNLFLPFLLTYIALSPLLIQVCKFEETWQNLTRKDLTRMNRSISDPRSETSQSECHPNPNWPGSLSCLKWWFRLKNNLKYHKLELQVASYLQLIRTDWPMPELSVLDSHPTGTDPTWPDPNPKLRSTCSLSLFHSNDYEVDKTNYEMD